MVPRETGQQKRPLKKVACDGTTTTHDIPRILQLIDWIGLGADTVKIESRQGYQAQNLTREELKIFLRLKVGKCPNTIHLHVVNIPYVVRYSCMLKC